MLVCFKFWLKICFFKMTNDCYWWIPTCWVSKGWKTIFGEFQTLELGPGIVFEWASRLPRCILRKRDPSTCKRSPRWISTSRYAPIPCIVYTIVPTFLRYTRNTRHPRELQTFSFLKGGGEETCRNLCVEMCRVTVGVLRFTVARDKMSQGQLLDGFYNTLHLPKGKSLA